MKSIISIIEHTVSCDSLVVRPDLHLNELQRVVVAFPRKPDDALKIGSA